MSQYAMEFKRFDDEMDLAKAIFAKTGRDLFAGVTEPKDRQAAARIAIVMNRLQSEFGAAYKSVYGEELPPVQRISQPETSKRKRA